MIQLSDILLLGDPRLHQPCEEVREDEIPTLLPAIKKMHALILAFREKYGFGRAIAAPQIGLMKRLVVRNCDEGIAQVFFNPRIVEESPETMDLWDNCMSFPNLYVHLKRHKWVRMSYHDITWDHREALLENEDAELLQHEIDHLDGILCIDRAAGSRALKWVSG